MSWEYYRMRFVAFLVTALDATLGGLGLVRRSRFVEAVERSWRFAEAHDVDRLKANLQEANSRVLAQAAELLESKVKLVAAEDEAQRARAANVQINAEKARIESENNRQRLAARDDLFACRDAFQRARDAADLVLRSLGNS